MCRQEAKVSPDLPTVGEHHKGGEEEIELLGLGLALGLGLGLGLTLT